VGSDTAGSGLDLAHLDTGVRPQDDLFGHVNGRWLAGYTMPADRATDGAFRALYDRAEEQVRELIIEAAAIAAADGRKAKKLLALGVEAGVLSDG
jgi:predicted metalloendopeptidase